MSYDLQSKYFTDKFGFGEMLLDPDTDTSALAAEQVPASVTYEGTAKDQSPHSTAASSASNKVPLKAARPPEQHTKPPKVCLAYLVEVSLTTPSRLVQEEEATAESEIVGRCSTTAYLTWHSLLATSDSGVEY